MASDVRIKGLDAAVRGLHLSVDKIDGAMIDRLLQAGLTIQRGAQQRTPVDTGNLRASAETRRHPQNKESVEVIYTAEYALDVHESVGRRHKTGQAKFLERAATDALGAINRMFQRRVL